MMIYTIQKIFMNISFQYCFITKLILLSKLFGAFTG